MSVEYDGSIDARGGAHPEGWLRRELPGSSCTVRLARYLLTESPLWPSTETISVFNIQKFTFL